MESLVITKKKRGEDGYKVFSVRLKEETLDRLNTLCQDTGRTRNELIGMLLDFALQHSKVAADKSSQNILNMRFSCTQKTGPCCLGFGFFNGNIR